MGDPTTSSMGGTWVQYFTDDPIRPKPYYHNAVLGLTQWEKPPTFIEEDQRSASPHDDSDALDIDVPDAYGFSSPLPGIHGAINLSTEKGVLTPSFASLAAAGLAGSLDSPMSRDSSEEKHMLQKEGEDRGGPQKICFFELNYLQSFFQVSSLDVLKRLLYALVPIKIILSSSSETATDYTGSPDFYGPFWIAATLSIFVFSSSNYARWMNNHHYHTDFSLFGVSTAIIYGSLGVLPSLAKLLHWLIQRKSPPNTTIQLDLRQLVCIYGYSLAVYIPASLLCIIPFSAAKWTISVLALFIAIVFTILALLKNLREAPRLILYLHFAYLTLAHVGIFLAFRLYFFR